MIPIYCSSITGDYCNKTQTKSTLFPEDLFKIINTEIFYELICKY